MPRQIPQIRKEKSNFLHASAQVLTHWLAGDEPRDVCVAFARASTWTDCGSVELQRIVNGYITELNTRTEEYEKHISKEFKAASDQLAAPRQPQTPKLRW